MGSYLHSLPYLAFPSTVLSEFVCCLIFLFLKEYKVCNDELYSAVWIWWYQFERPCIALMIFLWVRYCDLYKKTSAEHTTVPQMLKTLCCHVRDSVLETQWFTVCSVCTVNLASWIRMKYNAKSLFIVLHIILPVKRRACFDSFAFEKQHQGCCQTILLCIFV